MTHTTRLALLFIAGLTVGGCQKDSAGQGHFYDDAGGTGGAAGSGSAGTRGTAGVDGSTGMAGRLGVGGGSAGTAGALGVGGGGSAGTAGRLGVGGGGSAGTAGRLGVGGAADGGGGGGGVTSKAGSGGGAGSATNGGPCDLSGRWLVTEHTVTESLGQQQTVHTFIYYELERQGGSLVITKGLQCGNEALSGGALAIAFDTTASWPAVISKVTYVGRTVTTTQGANGCDVHFGKWYIVRGATLPYYLDPSNPLPTASQKASGSTPGWEDWDNDGNPGYTGSVTGTVVGRVFVAPRIWTELSATVRDVATKFTLPISWDQEANVMSYDPPENFTLGTPSVVAGDPALHFADFVRLAPDQATGDDAAICAAVVQLAPMLTPGADAI